MDDVAALASADLSHGEVDRRVGGTPASTDDAVRQRPQAFLAPYVTGDDPSGSSDPDDARRCGALVVRLDGDATTASLAEWLGWTMERTHTAMEALDRRLDACGLHLSADRDGRLAVRERARLRARPVETPLRLLERAAAEDLRHGLAHLVRGDRCPDGDGWVQPLLDVGTAMGGGYPPVRPCDEIAAAFVGVWRRTRRLPRFVEIGGATSFPL